MKPAVRITVAAVLALALVGCAGRQVGPQTPPELNTARLLDALAHGANAVAKEIAAVKQQGKITQEETQAIAAWCRAVDVAVPRAFEVLKTSDPQVRAAAVADALADVTSTGPLQQWIEKRGAQQDTAEAVALVRTAIIIVGELVPGVRNGKQ